VVIKLVIAGAAGRMGMRVADVALQDKGFKLVYGLEAKVKESAMSHTSFPAGSDADQIKNADVVVDFTTPPGSMIGVGPKIEKYKVRWVIGTTGFSMEQEEEIARIAKTIPILKSSNMSLGVNVFIKAAQGIAKALPMYKVRIQEAHHIHKKDKPSGTALQVGKLIEEASGQEVIYDEPIREGEIVGDHRVIFEGPEDRLELFHHAESRDIFVAGALQAARWIAAQKKPGLYTMHDVLGLND
jgi:4-hydroxy-tetrahydrodipicolinate reductase